MSFCYNDSLLPYNQSAEHLHLVEQCGTNLGKEVECPFPSSCALAAKIEMPWGVFGGFLSRDASLSGSKVAVLGSTTGRRNCKYSVNYVSLVVAIY